jgi:hypothetical protein
MSNLQETIVLIDDAVRAKVREAYGLVSCFGLAEMVNYDGGEQTDIVPCIINRFGDATKIVLDDGCDFMSYHRTLTTPVLSDTARAKGFGSAIRANFSMRMVVYAKRLELSLEDYALVIASYLNNSFGVATASATALQVNGLELWQTERVSSEYLVKTTRLFLAIDYNLSLPISTCPDLC